MFNRTRDEDPGLQKEIDHLLQDMSNVATLTDEYARMVKHLTKLYAIKNEKFKTRVSSDVKFTVLGNLAAVMMIVGHERANVITSKALNFIKMAR